MIEMSLTTLRRALAGLNRKHPGTVIRVTCRGTPCLAMMSSDLYDSIVETLSVMSDPDAVESLRGSLADIGTENAHGLGTITHRLRLRR